MPGAETQPRSYWALVTRRAWELTLADLGWNRVRPSVVKGLVFVVGLALLYVSGGLVALMVKMGDVGGTALVLAISFLLLLTTNLVRAAPALYAEAQEEIASLKR